MRNWSSPARAGRFCKRLLIAIKRKKTAPIYIANYGLNLRRKTMSYAAPDYDALIHEYARVCNAALDANKGCYPYMRVIVEVEERLKFHKVRVAVYDKDENHPEAFFELVVQDKQITVKPAHKPHAKHPWLVSRLYLEEIARQPDIYINNPADLDWRWLNDHELG
jgi:hypothetical protein